MQFHLSDEQEMIRGTVDRAFGALVSGRLASLLDSDTDFDRDTWDLAVELGLPGLMVNEEEGGSGLGLLEAALASEMLGYHAAPGPLVPHILATAAIARASGNAAARFLPRLLSGDMVAVVALAPECSPGAAMLLANDGTTSGRLTTVPGAQHADLILVVLAGYRLGIVETGNVSVQIQPLSSADVTRRVANVTFDRAPVIDLGDAAHTSWLYDAALVLQAADCLGGAQRCLNQSLAYANERYQFGVPIGQFQAVKHQLADLALAIEPSRALLWYAAYAADSDGDDRAFAASHAKAHLSTSFTEAARRAIQIHGGVGYTWELGLHLWLRRALFNHAYLGQPAFHRERALALSGL